MSDKDQQKEANKSIFNNLFYPDSKTMVNLFNERNNGTLAEIERAVSSLAQADAKKHPLKGDFDLAHMKEIHKKLFGDVYKWAGQERETTLFKKRADGFTTEFARPNEIKSLDKQLKELVKETLAAKGTKDVPEKLAKVYQITNEMHPFYEGNGRTQRVFLDYLAKEAGFKLDFSKVDKHAWNHAASMSAKINIGNDQRIPGRLDELNKVFKHIAQPLEKQSAYSKGRTGGATELSAPNKVLQLADLNIKASDEKKTGFKLK